MKKTLDDSLLETQIKMIDLMSQNAELLEALEEIASFRMLMKSHIKEHKSASFSLLTNAIYVAAEAIRKAQEVLR